MSYTPYFPNERIVDRAVALWCRLLANPIYQIERPEHATPQTVMSEALAKCMPKNNTDPVLTAFGTELKKLLMAPRQQNIDPQRTVYEGELRVDYSPCRILAQAATAAGLDMEFPYKTYMALMSNSLEFSIGYGGKRLNHYPMADGKWLVTTLYGTDIDKVLEYVAGGTPAFTVEQEPA